MPIALRPCVPIRPAFRNVLLWYRRFPAVCLVMWMVYFRLSIFEFATEASSRHHAIRRHYVSAMLWMSTSTLATGSLLIVGYIVRACGVHRACVHACARCV